jgi:26S proteasome regulatory subunit T3
MEELGIEKSPVSGDSSNNGLENVKPTEELSGDGDLYTKYIKLKKQIEFLDVQEEYIKDEMRNLRKV